MMVPVSDFHTPKSPYDIAVNGWHPVFSLVYQIQPAKPMLSGAVYAI